jgi:hypothetical protein
MLANCNQPSKKRKESKALASYIKRTSFEMFLYSNYKKGNKRYFVFNKESFSCYFKYVFQKAYYNVKGILVSK